MKQRFSRLANQDRLSEGKDKIYGVFFFFFFSVDFLERCLLSHVLPKSMWQADYIEDCIMDMDEKAG